MGLSFGMLLPVLEQELPLLPVAEKYFVWLMFYSALGWLYESSYATLCEHHFVNRGFFRGPYCPIYGSGAILDCLLLGRLENPAAIFLLGAAGACALEYATSYAMEKLFHARWWDYSEIRFNVNGRICLPGAVIFGVFSVFLLKIAQPVVVYCTAEASARWLHGGAVLLLAAFLLDCLVTLHRMRGGAKRGE